MLFLDREEKTTYYHLAMTAYSIGYTPTISQQVQTAREKRKRILAAVMKRRRENYIRFLHRRSFSIETE